jgi:hypothetical protein
MSLTRINGGLQADYFIGSPFPTQGKVFHVKPSSGLDGNDGLSPERAFKTLAKALSKATADKNDVVLFYAEDNSASGTTDYQSTALDWNKDLVHLIGVNSGAMIGQRSRIAQLSTVKTIENLFTVSASGCIIANLEVFQGVATSTATSPVAFTLSGQRNHVINCQFSGNGDTGGSMDNAGARSMILSGSENTIEKCYIGLDTVIRATQAAEIGLTGTPTRNIFKDCTINSYTSATGFLGCTVIAGMDRFTMFENCKFLCSENITSAVQPDAVFGGGIATINGVIHLVNPYTNYTQYAGADAPRVKALGKDGTATGNLIGVAQAIDVA